MIYATAATSGPSLTLLKGCLWLLLPWSMRCPSFFGSAAAPLRLALFFVVLVLSRYGLAVAETLAVAARRCGRLGSLRNSTIAQLYGRPARLAKFGLAC